MFALRKGGRAKVVGVPIGTDAFAVNSAVEIIRDEGAEQLERILPRVPDKRSANFIATSAMVRWICYYERVMDPRLSLHACQPANTSAMWILERLFELPRTADEWPFFEKICPANWLKE